MKKPLDDNQKWRPKARQTTIKAPQKSDKKHYINDDENTKKKLMTKTLHNDDESTKNKKTTARTSQNDESTKNTKKTMSKTLHSNDEKK